MSPLIPVVLILAAVVGIPLLIVGVIYMIVPAAKGIVWAVRQVTRFVFGEVSDVLRGIGAVITLVALVPLVIGNVALGRWSAAAHFGRAIQGEAKAALRCAYRVLIGHPARLLCLTPLTEGLEKRIPEVVAAAPGADRPRGRARQFDGYTIVGSLPGGGSGGRLYIAEPNAQKRAMFERWGSGDVDRVVIKCFSLHEGSSLPQIIRESRALDAARRLGLILEHELTEERFYYVTRYIPGESLGLVTQRLHAACGPEGLGERELREVLEYTCDLLRTLTHYHTGGLWHKDVKPDNIIIAHGQAHLVDFGLVTPLRSAMTLTTHGTEYFRDPEMVRMALKGVKVHQVDGAKFDVYAAGAVLYSMVENSFPAHGGLSQIGKRCPEAVRWIVRRAMTDYDKRYESAAAMLADVEAVLAAEDVFAVRPAALPSVRGVDVEMAGGEGGAEAAREEAFAGSPRPGAGVGAVGVAAAAVGAAVVGAAAPAAAGRVRPRIRVTSWWSGGYVVDGVDAAGTPEASLSAPPPPPPPPPPAFVRRNAGVKAEEQLRRARERAAAARARARERMGRHDRNFPAGVNAGVVAALLLFLAAGAALVVVMASYAVRQQGRVMVVVDGEEAPAAWSASAELAARMQEAGTRARESAERLRTRRVPAAASPAERAAQFEGERILVVREPFTLTPGVEETVDGLLGRLRGAGFELVGNTDQTPADKEEAARQVNLVANLRTEVGVVPVPSKDGAERVKRWLEAHGEFPVVVWFGRGEGDRVQPWVIGRERADARLIEGVRELLAGAR